MFEIVIHNKPKDIRKTFKTSAVTLGRRLGNDVHLDSPSVSKDHARIEERRKGYVLVDLESSNGTFVNGKRVDKVLLKSGDMIKMGNVEMVFYESATPDLEEQVKDTAEQMNNGVGYETMLARITKDMKDRDLAVMKNRASEQDTHLLVENFLEMGWSLSEAEALAEETKGKPAKEIEEAAVVEVSKPKPTEVVLHTSRALPEVERGRMVRFKGEEFFAVECRSVGDRWEYRLKRC